MLTQLAAAPLATPSIELGAAVAPTGTYAAAGSWLPTVPAASSPVLTR